MNWLFVGGVVVAVLFVLKQLLSRGSGSWSKAYFLRYDGVHEVVRFESLTAFSIRNGMEVGNYGFRAGDVLDVYGDSSWLISADLVKQLSKQVKDQVLVTKQDLISGVQAAIKAKKEVGAKQ